MSDPTPKGRLHLLGHLFCASPQEQALVEQYLPEHIRLTRAEPGCVSFEVTQTDNPSVWRVEEWFADRAAFDAHQLRAGSSLWGQKTQGIRRDYQITED